MLTGSVFGAGMHDDSDEKSSPLRATFKAEAKKYLRALVEPEEGEDFMQRVLTSLAGLTGNLDFFNSSRFLVTIAPFFDNDHVDDAILRVTVQFDVSGTKWAQTNFGNMEQSYTLETCKFKPCGLISVFKFNQTGCTHITDLMNYDEEEISCQPRFGLGTAGQLSSSVVTTSKPGDSVGISHSEQDDVDQLKQIQAMKLREEHSDDESDDVDAANTNADV